MILSSRPSPSSSASHFDHSSSLVWKTLTTASKSSLGNALSSLSSHAHNIPTITLEAQPASRVKPRASSSPPVSIPSLDVLPLWSARTTTPGLIASPSPPLPHHLLCTKYCLRQDLCLQPIQLIPLPSPLRIAEIMTLSMRKSLSIWTLTQPRHTPGSGFAHTRRNP